MTTSMLLWLKKVATQTTDFTNEGPITALEVQPCQVLKCRIGFCILGCWWAHCHNRTLHKELFHPDPREEMCEPE